MGPEASLPARVVFRFLRSRCNRDVGMVLPLRDALCNWLQTRGSPFRVVVQESSTAVFHRLEAAGPDVAAWLLKDSMAIALLQYGGGSFATSTAVGSRDILGAGLEGSADEVVQDAELEVCIRRCGDVFVVLWLWVPWAIVHALDHTKWQIGSWASAVCSVTVQRLRPGAMPTGPFCRVLATVHILQVVAYMDHPRDSNPHDPL